MDAVGGTLHGFWYALGEHDAYALYEAPDTVSIAAMALAINSGGALSAYQTIPLLTVEEALAAMRKAAEAMRPGCHQDRGPSDCARFGRFTFDSYA